MKRLWGRGKGWTGKGCGEQLHERRCFRHCSLRWQQDLGLLPSECTVVLGKACSRWMQSLHDFPAPAKGLPTASENSCRFCCSQLRCRPQEAASPFRKETPVINGGREHLRIDGLHQSSFSVLRSRESCPTCFPLGKHQCRGSLLGERTASEAARRTKPF